MAPAKTHRPIEARLKREFVTKDRLSRLLCDYPTVSERISTRAHEHYHIVHRYSRNESLDEAATRNYKPMAHVSAGKVSHMLERGDLGDYLDSKGDTRQTNG